MISGSCEGWIRRVRFYCQFTTAAAKTAAEHVNDELGVDEVGGGITSGILDRDRAAIVTVTTLLDRDGDVIRETAVEFDTLVAITPASVDALYVLDGHEYELEVPVYAQHSVIRQE